ncbi:ribosomal protein L1 [Gonapodya prolifera JEL478]|uniref:Ribosomal protein L1 n=1 Tax=Gonapodya prolifera (strain JEL478) TaxID=1344416 RepID=A0A139AV88_GONPJ|nr:ribosomal protein L1 [Gonapodya prolifera JEL478]|eukprot:KXS20650.1 ribosomal protein L1 [Gonapodya prolifera JEL478]
MRPTHPLCTLTAPLLIAVSRSQPSSALNTVPRRASLPSHPILPLNPTRSLHEHLKHLRRGKDPRDPYHFAVVALPPAPPKRYRPRLPREDTTADTPKSLAEALAAIELVAPESSYVLSRVRLNLDTSLKSFVPVRGRAQVPRGVLPRAETDGEEEQVLVFAEEGPAAEEARAAGAEVLGKDDIEKLTDNTLDLTKFARALATPAMYPLITPFGRLLGPLGLMPNPKKGGVTEALGAAIEGARAASFVNFEMKDKDKEGGTVEVEVGKVGWGAAEVRENIGAVLKAIVEANENKKKHMIVHSLYLASKEHPVRFPVRLKEFGTHLVSAKIQKK